MAETFFSFAGLAFLAFFVFGSAAGAPALASSASFFDANGPRSSPPSLGTSQKRPLASFFTWTALLVAFGALDLVVVFLAMIKLLTRVDGRAAIIRRRGPPAA